MKKDILLSIQDRLAAEVPELRYIDKNWGQLAMAHPAVAFPCALLDFRSTKFSQTGGGGQIADASVVVVVANQRLVPSSATAPNREQSYLMLELCERIHRVLHLHHTEEYAPLVRTEVKNVFTNSSYEAYEITYQTAYMVEGIQEGSTVKGGSVKIDIRGGFR